MNLQKRDFVISSKQNISFLLVFMRVKIVLHIRVGMGV